MNLESFCNKLEEELLCTECPQEKVGIVEALLNKFCCGGIDCSKEWDCTEGRYARHLVYNGRESGCCIVAMSWGPGQGTPIHDHDGTWCVECCLEGNLEVVQYELEETKEDAEGLVYVFDPKETQVVGKGAVGCLIPPFEHHIIRNPYDKRAVTLHVYGKELTKSSCFYPTEGDKHYRRHEKCLGYSELAH